MEKRPPLILDGDCDLDEIFDANRDDSIRWACMRCEDDPETRVYVCGFRRQFRERLTKDFPYESKLWTKKLLDDEDVDHFFVLLGKFANTSYSVALKEMGRFYCEILKAKMNLDLHPSVFSVEHV